MRSTPLGGVLASALVLSALPLAPALAAPGDPQRPAVEQYYAPTPDAWSPQGTLIATSGFDPTIDSFSFPNYSNEIAGNTSILGYAEGQPVLNLTAIEAQRLFGSKAACTYGSGQDCFLNPVMASWLATTSLGMAGGHCFGMAAVVAGLFDGVISRAGLTPSAVNSTVAFSPVVQRTIAQWFATQTFVLGDEDLYAADFLPPDQIVNQLVQFLPSKTLPYVLAIWIYEEVDGEVVIAGGHGITPYAVYDRGNGLVDIAVYDNNYPLRARAIHVDLNTNSWEYEVATIPGKPPVIAWGDAEHIGMGLIPLAQLTGEKDCYFCEGADEGSSVVSGSPLLGTLDLTEARLSVTDRSGREIKGVKPRPALVPNPAGFALTVPTSADYRLDMTVPEKAFTLDYPLGLALLDSHSPGEAFEGLVMSRPGGRASAMFGGRSERVEVGGNKDGVVVQVTMHRDRRLVDYSLTATVADGPWSKAWMKGRPVQTPAYLLDEDGQSVTFEYAGKEPMLFTLSAQRVSPSTGPTSATVAGKGIRMRTGDRVTLDLATWRHGGKPELTLTDSRGRSRSLDSRVIGLSAYQQVTSEEQFGGWVSR